MAALAPQVIQHPATHVPPGQSRKLHPAAAVEPPSGLTQAQGTLLEEVIPKFCITARVARRQGPQCRAKLQKQLDEAKAGSAKLQAQCDEAKAGCAKLQAQLTDSNAHGVDLQAKLDAAQAELAKLQPKAKK